MVDACVGGIVDTLVKSRMAGRNGAFRVDTSIAEASRLPGESALRAILRPLTSR